MKIFSLKFVQFGDFPAAVIMTIAVEMAPESCQKVAKAMNLDIYKVKDGSIKLLKDTYVDD